MKWKWTSVLVLVGLLAGGCGRREKALPVVVIPPPYFSLCTNCNSFVAYDDKGHTNTLSPVGFVACTHQWRFLFGKEYGIQMREKESLFAPAVLSNFEESAWAMRPQKR